MPEFVGVTLLSTGVFFVVAAVLWLVVVAFRTSIWWGLGILLFFPLAIVYAVKHWSRARKPLVLFLSGIVLTLGTLGYSRLAPRDFGPLERPVEDRSAT